MLTHTNISNHRLKMSEVEQAKAVAQVREKRMVRVSSFSVPITPIGKGFSSENVESTRRAIRHVFDRFYFGASFYEFLTISLYQFVKILRIRTNSNEKDIRSRQAVCVHSRYGKVLRCDGGDGYGETSHITSNVSYNTQHSTQQFR